MPSRSAASRAASCPAASGLTAKTADCILTPAGMPRIGSSLAHRIEDIARRAVAAGEEDQRHAAVPKHPCRASGILGRGLRRGRALDHLDIEASGFRDIGTQGTRRRQDRGSARIGGKPRQRAPCAGRREGLGAQRARAGQGGGAVRALEGGAAAHAGDGIDDETDLARGRGHGMLGMLRRAGIQPNDAGHRGQPPRALPGCS